MLLNKTAKVAAVVLMVCLFMKIALATPIAPILISYPRATNSLVLNVIGYMNESEINVTVTTSTSGGGQYHLNWTIVNISSTLLNQTTVNAQNAANSIFVVDGEGDKFGVGDIVRFSSHNRTYFELYNVTSIEYRGGNTDMINISPDLEHDVFSDDSIFIYNTTNGTYPAGWFNISAYLYEGNNSIIVEGEDLSGNDGPQTSFYIYYDNIYPDIYFLIPNSTTSHTSIISFNVTDNFELNISSVELNITNGASSTIYNNENITCTNSAVNISNCSVSVYLDNGFYNLTFRVNDLANNLNISYKYNYNVSVLDQAPTIISVYTNKTIVIANTNFTIFTYNVSSINNDVLQFICSNVTTPNITNSLCLENISSSEYSSLNCTITAQDTTINVTYFCAVNGSGYVSNIVNISIYSDDEGPKLYPGFGTGFDDTSVEFLFNITDNFQLDLNTFSLNISNSSTYTTYNLSNITCTSPSVNFSNCSLSTVLSIGGYNLTFTFNDSAGNQNTTIFEYWIDLSAPVMLTVNDSGTYSTNASLYANWTAQDNELPMDYEYSIGTDVYSNDGWNSTRSWTSVGSNNSVTASNLSLENYVTYYFSVRAKNKAGTYSNVVSTDGVTINDQSNPLVTSLEDQGNFSSSNTTLTFSWSAEDPESGIAYYEYSLGNDSYTNSVTDWNNIIDQTRIYTTNVTITGLNLETNKTYYFTIIAYNGDLGDSRNSTDGITIDTTPIINGTIAYASIETKNYTTINLSKGYDSISGIKEDILYMRNASLIGGNCINWTDWSPSNYTNLSATEINLSITSGYCYKFNYSVENWASLFSYYANDSHELKVDYTIPSTPIITDDGFVTGSPVINAAFSSQDNESNISYYEYAIGNSKYNNSGWDLYSGLTNITDASISVSNITFIDDRIYYISARAVNSFGNYSEFGSSDGILYNDITPPTTFLVSVNNITNASDGYSFTTSAEVNITVEGEEGMHCKHYSIDTAYLEEWGTDCTTTGNQSSCNVTPSVSGTNRVSVSCKDNSTLPNKQNSSNNIDVSWISNWLTPNITLVYPQNGSVVAAGSISINITTIENATCMILEGANQYDMSGAGLKHAYNKIVLANTTYTFTFNCTDSLNDSATSLLTFSAWDKLVTIHSLNFDRNLLYINQSLELRLLLTMANNISSILVNITRADNTTFILTEANFSNISAPVSNTRITANFTNNTNVTGTYSVYLFINDTNGINANITSTFKVFANITHTLNLNSTESLYINYLNPDDGSSISNYSASGYNYTKLPNTLLDLEITNKNQSFKIKIPSLNLSSTDGLNISARNISFDDITNNSLNLGQNTSYKYMIKYGYVLEIVNSSSLNKQIMVIFNYSNLNISRPNGLSIFKAPYDISTEIIDFASGGFETTYYDNSKNIAWINVTSLSIFLLTYNRCLDGIKNGDETGVDCGGSSCSACSSQSLGTSSGGGGGGGRGGGAPEYEESNILESMTQLWNVVNAGEIITMKVKNIDIIITEVSVFVKNSLNNVKLTISSLKKRPESTDSLVKNIYQYLEIEASNINDLDVSFIKIKFSVSKAWITENAADDTDIFLYWYKNGGWNSLSATKTNSNSDFVYYESTSYGFGYYAVGSSRVSYPEETLPEMVHPPEEIKEETELKSPEQISKLWIVVIILATFVITVIAILSYKYFRKKETQGPRELINYIRTCLFDGIMPEQIKVYLLKIGWKKDTIDYQIANVYNSVSLSNYIRLCTSRGWTKKQIKQDILKRGWTKKSIKSFLAKIKEPKK